MNPEHDPCSPYYDPTGPYASGPAKSEEECAEIKRNKEAEAADRKQKMLARAATNKAAEHARKLQISQHNANMDLMMNVANGIIPYESLTDAQQYGYDIYIQMHGDMGPNRYNRRNNTGNTGLPPMKRGRNMNLSGGSAFSFTRLFSSKKSGSKRKSSSSRKSKRTQKRC